MCDSLIGRQGSVPPMHRTIGQFFSDLFPGLGLPAYQSVMETLSFLLVATMLVGTLSAALVLLAYEL